MNLNVETLNLINTSKITNDLNREALKVEKEKLEDIKQDKEVDVSVIKNMASTDSLKNQMRVNNEVLKKVEKEVSVLQTASKGLFEQKEIITKIKDVLEKNGNDELSPSKVESIKKQLKEYIEDIDKVTKLTKFDYKELLNDGYHEKIDDIEINIDISNSKSLGLSEFKEIYTLNGVSVGGENYLPNYSFDISNMSGSSSILSIVDSAITKIDSIIQEITSSINELVQYPQILELDHTEYSSQQSRVRNIETARQLATRLKSSVRYKINEVQYQQTFNRASAFVDLLSP